MLSAWKLAALSRSLMVSVPVAVWAALVSVKSAVLTPAITAASLVPQIVTVMRCTVPSALKASKWSV